MPVGAHRLIEDPTPIRLGRLPAHSAQLVCNTLFVALTNVVEGLAALAPALWFTPPPLADSATRSSTNVSDL